MRNKILFGLLAIVVVIQFFRPERNTSNDNTYHVSTVYDIPEDVAGILKVACNDCHSNMTRYPWYTNIQPVGWWLNDHVEHGKRHLNFSEFVNRRVAIQNHKFEEIIESMEDQWMPLASYTALGLHADANLTTEQRQAVIDWARAQMDLLASKHPADSLVLRRR